MRFLLTAGALSAFQFKQLADKNKRSLTSLFGRVQLLSTLRGTINHRCIDSIMSSLLFIQFIGSHHSPQTSTGSFVFFGNSQLLKFQLHHMPHSFFSPPSFSEIPPTFIKFLTFANSYAYLSKT